MTGPHHPLLQMHVEALFTHDSDGRIAMMNEPEGDPAPRFFLARTRDGTTWRIGRDVPPDTAQRLAQLGAREPVGGDLRSPPRCFDAVVEALGRDRAVQSVESGPAYAFPDTLPMPANLVRITKADVHVLRGMVEELDAVLRHFEAREPRVAVIEDGVAVSLCYSARLTAAAAEAGVVTLEPHRGRGHATAVVAGWAQAVRATGRIPLYSTSWDNVASQAVARKLALLQYATDLTVD